MKELLFLTIANNLPRLNFLDRLRWRLLKLSGMQIDGKCSIWGPIVIRPIGGAKNIHIGKDSFLNTNIRFGVPKCQVIIGRRSQIGPGVMFETVSHGLLYKEGEGRG